MGRPSYLKIPSKPKMAGVVSCKRAIDGSCHVR